MDKDFFVEELQTHHAMLYRVAYTILQNDDACCDALQDAALKAWEKRHTLRETRYFRTWVTRILINACYDTRRRHRRIVVMEEIPEQSVPPEDPALAMALEQLPERLRLPLVLHYAEGMSYAEIADALCLPVPEACHRALMDAARSVREEKPVKRVSYRAALIAAVILLAAMAVAYAAVRLGWIEYFSQQYGIAVPRVAQEALESSQPKTCQVGPMTFTYQQLLTDRRIVLSSAAVSLTDDGEALYADDTNVYESISAISDTVASRYSLTDHSMTWLEAAQELELPLYGVRALVELPPESDLGSSMEDALWNEDGTIVYFNMPMLAPGSADGDVNATLYMAVTQFDPATGEALEKWETREKVTLPVAPLLEEKTYLPQEKASFDGLALESVHGERYATGVYLCATFTAPDGMTKEEAMDVLHTLSICDADGAPLPMGLSLSICPDAEALPVVTLEVPASLEALPDEVTVVGGETIVSLK